LTDAVFFKSPLPADELVRLDGAEGRHAATVRRLGIGEPVVLTDGNGQRRAGVVEGVGRDWLDVRCQPIISVPAPAPRLIAVQALAKGDRAELAVELMTELGVDEIVPWTASRSIVQWRGDRADRSLERWRRTAFEAGKQSRRAWFPAVAEAATTAQVATRIRAAGGAFVLHESATEPLVQAALGFAGDLLIVIGPEGGIADIELSVFVDAGAVAVRLGEPVLRTSTAGAAALAALAVRLGRWS
jgi:16S rRNA (uracil1498-N3)-methyltransferase